MSERKYLYWASLGICAVLYFIWPTTHTMALRKVLLLSGAAVGVLLWFRSTERNAILKSSWLMYAGLLLAWVIFHAAVLSQNGREAWSELLGQWLPSYMAMLAGIGVALATRSISSRALGIYLVVLLAAQPIFYLLMILIKSVQTGYIAIGFWGLSDHKLSLTFYADLLAAASCAKMIDAVQSRESTTRIYLWMLPVALSFDVALLAESLNGLLLVIGCVVLAGGVLVYQARQKIGKGTFVAATLLVIMVMYALSTSAYLAAKWDTLASNSRIAVSIDAYPNWTDFSRLGLPRDEQGIQVKESYYLRVAYATAGLNTILEHPWGYGVTRHAFERLVQQKHPDANIANSHNAYIDLVSAVGFPALLLLAMVVISVLKQLKSSDSEWARPATWMIGIIAVHWMLDPISRDHYLETFLFLIGLLAVLTHKNSIEYARQS